MKKMLVLLLVAVAMAPAMMAQPGRGNNKDNDKGYGGSGIYDGRDKRPGNDSYSFSKKERDAQIAQINSVYDNKIRKVRNSFFMNRFKKERQVQDLEQQRREEIRKVNAKFNDRRNRYDDRDNRWRN